MRTIVFALTLFGLYLPTMAAIKTETIEYTQKDKNFKGYLAYDDATSDKRPGILIVPEWWGINDYVKGRADQLAKLGYVAFVADMYGDGVVTTDPKQAGAWSGPVMNDRQMMRDRVTAAFEQLQKVATVDQPKVAAIGYCFGGTSVLELARSGASVLGVVGFHAGLATPTPEDAKNIKAKVLVLTGAADPMVVADQRTAFAKEMTEAKVNWELDLYCDAKHAFSNPKADDYGVPGVAYNKQADERSFARMKAFFDEIFK